MNYKLLDALILILTLSIIKTINCQNCHKRYIKDEQDWTAMSCENRNCLVEIKPIPSKAIRLSFEGGLAPEGFVQIWESFTENDQQITVMKGNPSMNHIFNHKYDIVSKVGSSLVLGYVLSASDECRFYSLPKVKFARIDEKSYLNDCDSTLRYIGHEVETIQHKTVKQGYQSCPYRLLSKFNASNENLYITTSGDDYTALFIVKNNQSEKLNQKLLIFNNWETLDILITAAQTEYYGRKGEATTMQIKAVSTNRSCDCDNKPILLSSLAEAITLRSPGFPDFGCPQLNCKTRIEFPPISVSQDMISRVLVSIDMLPKPRVLLDFESDTVTFTFDSSRISYIKTDLLLDESNLNLIYRTPSDLSRSLEGHYILNITRVSIQKECDCTLFTQKMYYQEKVINMFIPPGCETMICDWTIFFQSKKQVSIVLTDGNDDDKVHVWSKGIMEVYKGEDDLKYPRKMFIPHKDKEVHVSFFRKSKGLEGAKLTINITAVSDTSCASTLYVDVTSIPQSFTSPNFPMTYKSMNCQYVLHAPENQTIAVFLAEIDVKQIHDHISFYDGSSTSSRFIKHFSGKNRSQMIYSTGNEMFVSFDTDPHYAGRGYHFSVFSVPVNTSNTLSTRALSPPTVASIVPSIVSTVESQKSNEISVLPFILSLVLLIVIGVAFGIGLIFLKKHKTSAAPFRSFSNATVTYRTNENEAPVTIST